MPQNIGDNRVIENGIARITEQDAERLNKYRVRVGDIVYSRRGDVERRALIREHEEGWLCGTGSLRIRFGHAAVDPVYAAFYLGHPSVREWIVRHAHGATMPNLNTSILSSMPFVLPPLPEQRAIAAILGALDDKIELNRQMNRTLEAMAQALFKSWFVDFEPVRAKAEGRETGLPDQVAALFPDRLVESEMGAIPGGWKVEQLEQHIFAEKGLSYKGEFLSKAGGIPMHNLNSVHEGGGYKYEGIKYYTGDYKERHVLFAGEIIVANTEQGFDYLLIGYPAIVPKYYGETGIFSHHIFRVRPLDTSPIKTHFLYHLLMSPRVREQIIGCTNGTTVNMLNISGLRFPYFVVPLPELINAFENLATPAIARLEQNYEQTRTLAALRDTLLPKLISGEVRVKDAEKFV